ncbi:hypothetical protein BGZ65_004356, partial [Modicella reniformis]
EVTSIPTPDHCNTASEEPICAIDVRAHVAETDLLAELGSIHDIVYGATPAPETIYFSLELKDEVILSEQACLDRAILSVVHHSRSPSCPFLGSAASSNQPCDH